MSSMRRVVSACVMLCLATSQTCTDPAKCATPTDDATSLMQKKIHVHKGNDDKEGEQAAADKCHPNACQSVQACTSPACQKCPSCQQLGETAPKSAADGCKLCNSVKACQSPACKKCPECQADRCENCRGGVICQSPGCKNCPRCQTTTAPKTADEGLQPEAPAAGAGPVKPNDGAGAGAGAVAGAGAGAPEGPAVISQEAPAGPEPQASPVEPDDGAPAGPPAAEPQAPAGPPAVEPQAPSGCEVKWCNLMKGKEMEKGQGGAGSTCKNTLCTGCGFCNGLAS